MGGLATICRRAGGSAWYGVDRVRRQSARPRQLQRHVGHHRRAGAASRLEGVSSFPLLFPSGSSLFLNGEAVPARPSGLPHAKPFPLPREGWIALRILFLLDFLLTGRSLSAQWPAARPTIQAPAENIILPFPDPLPSGFPPSSRPPGKERGRPPLPNGMPFDRDVSLFLIPRLDSLPLTMLPPHSAVYGPLEAAALGTRALCGRLRV